MINGGVEMVELVSAVLLLPKQRNDLAGISFVLTSGQWSLI